MSNKNLLLLLVAAVVLSAVTGLLYVGDDKPEREFESGTPLVQGLPVEKVQSIEIKGGSDSVTLRRSGESFVLANKNNYPASTDKVNNLLTSIIDIRCERKVTDSSENYADLGVKEGGSGATMISFFDSSGTKLLGLIKGKTDENSRGAYVRKMGKDNVFLTQEYLSLNSAPLDYVDKNLLSLSKDKMKWVKVDVKKDSYRLVKNDDGDAELKNVPEGKQLKQSPANNAFTALTNMRFDDMHPAGEVDIEKWDGDYRCRLSSGITYRVRTAKKDDTYYARFSAKAQASDVEITGTESEEQLKKKQKAKNRAQEAAQTARTFNQKHGNWIYEIAEWRANKLRKPLSELVEAKKPEKISARQILVSHTDARESKADRSKSEAKKLAQDLLKQLQDDEAGFAELARKHSDGPNADKGGDLGTVEQGSRNEKFEAAAFTLEPGQVSDVVETPFGFHIIKRTE